VGWAHWGDESSFSVCADLQIGEATVQWSALHVPRLRVSHPVHLMLIEGAAPAWLFMGAKVLGFGALEGMHIHGPLLLLRVMWPALHTVPFELTNVVFGIPQALPAGIKLTDLLPAMISTLPTLSVS
jgi:hypothetical protein